MRISKLRSAWIIFASMLYTANASILSIAKSLTGKTKRPWVDQTIDRWISRLLNAVEVDCEVFNPHNTQFEQGRPTIIMCNHTSMYDIPITYKAFPKQSIRMLAKKELSRVPLLGKGMKAAEFPFVDRKNRRQAIKDLAYATQLMESGIVLWLAPEGTRSKTGKLGAFKKGGFITAIQSKATIIPIGIRGAHDILPAKTFRFNIRRKAEMHVGKPVDASKYKLNEKEQLLNEVREQMLELVGEKQP